LIKILTWSEAVFLGLNTVGAVEATRNNLVVGLQWTAPGGDSYLGTGQTLVVVVKDSDSPSYTQGQTLVVVVVVVKDSDSPS
jgi:hypothetical protein